MIAGAPGLRVFVVDDNHLIRRLLVMILESGGFQGIEAESAEDALALASGTPPDLWLVDEVMPGMTGSELVRRLRRSLDRRLSGAPMVGISGRRGAAGDLLTAGCDAFVAKPIDERRVLDAVRRAAMSRRSVASDHVPAA
jgi:CheY-like chemotaxis protein